MLVNLDPRNRQECTYEVPLWEFGLPDHGAIEAEDLLNGGRFTLHGKTHRIALDPAERPVVDLAPDPAGMRGRQMYGPVLAADAHPRETPRFKEVSP